jgi:hypothetical protein
MVSRFVREAVFGRESRRLAREEIPTEILVKISGHLRAADELLGPRDVEVGICVERAQVRIEGLLGTLPVRGERPRGTAVEHLEEAVALAEEHLGFSGVGGQIRRAVEEALSEALSQEEP